jgi:hypothetical protein
MGENEKRAKEREEDKAHDRAMEHYRAKNDHNRMINEISSAQSRTSFEAAIQYSLIAIKGTMLLNGASALALLSFMATGPAARHYAMLKALKAFAWGAVLPVTSAGISYLGQIAFTEHTNCRWAEEIKSKDADNKKTRLNKAKGIACQILGVLLIIVALLCFLYGVFQAQEHLFTMSNNGKSPCQ